MPGRVSRKNPSAARDPGLADQLREWIAKSGLSESEIARRSEIDPAQVHRFMSGERDLRLETAALICRALALHLAEVSRGRGRPKMTRTDRAGMSFRPEKTGACEEENPPETDRAGELEV